MVGSKAITNGLDLYLEKNKDISFIVYRDHQCCSQTDNRTRCSNKEDKPVPSDFLVKEAISIVSEDLSQTLQVVANIALDDLSVPTFETHDEFLVPFLWWYHRRKEIAKLKPEFASKEQENLSVFEDYIEESIQPEWLKVDSLLSKGMISAQYMHYLFVS